MEPVLRQRLLLCGIILLKQISHTTRDDQYMKQQVGRVLRNRFKFNFFQSCKYWIIQLYVVIVRTSTVLVLNSTFLSMLGTQLRYVYRRSSRDLLGYTGVNTITRYSVTKLYEYYSIADIT